MCIQDDVSFYNPVLVSVQLLMIYVCCCSLQIATKNDSTFVVTKDKHVKFSKVLLLFIYIHTLHNFIGMLLITQVLLKLFLPY